ncbi:HNH endonuclease [Oceanobacillus jeddahense]|uniref:HNH endonuclease n=1 Tax=Oceanobacillus jeddahense TaxID=1462527 RepID=A0ABY5JRW1_9BACI|nr:HNH endonuclease [Oceanobacillus jeddahense]UUI03065.1 HNH endonuclease [Oceanobacillus jeddahense]
MLVEEYKAYLKNPETRFFIIDTHGGKDIQNIYEDKDFVKYAWDTSKFGKVRKNDMFIYRRPGKNSELKEFYFFGAGVFGEIEKSESDNHVFSYIHTSVRFKNYISATDERLAAYQWKFKTRVKDNWAHFFNQYGMNEIKKEDFEFLLGLGIDSDDYTLLDGETNIADQKDMADELATTAVDKEGKRIKVYGYRYERKPKLRKEALKIHGYTCKACGFNFEDNYGEIGKDFIEVHHVKPLSEVQEESEVDPRHDLVPLCSNCHRMIHRKRGGMLGVEELKAIIESSKVV